MLAAYAAAISGSTDSTKDGAQAEALGGGTAGAQPNLSSSKSRGAVMLCVVGGKLSEGINFGDGLGRWVGRGGARGCAGVADSNLLGAVLSPQGPWVRKADHVIPVCSANLLLLAWLCRCVVVVGLPYPNSTDVELQARMHYLDRLAAAAAAASRPTDAATACEAAAATAVAQQHHAADAADTRQPQPQPQQTHLAVAPARRSAFQVLNQGGNRLLQAAAPEPIAGPAQPSPATSSALPLSAPVAVSPPTPQQQSAGPAAASGAPPGGQQAAGQPGAPAATDSSSGSRRLLTGRDYYEDLCFKAVNQCVGRVVRHRGDYAAVVLVDQRWVAGPAEWAAISSRSGRKVPVQKLPGWLQRSYVPTGGDFGPALKQLAAFYKRQAVKSGGNVGEVT